MRRLAVAFVAVAFVAVAAGATGVQAQADPAPPPATPTVSAAMLPTWQINGVVWSQAIVGNTVYVTGSFTKARPPGVPVGGAGEVTANNLFAFDITTGNRVAVVQSLPRTRRACSSPPRPDGSRVYVGGDFTTVDGSPARARRRLLHRQQLARRNVGPNVGGQVRGFAATSDTVYVGGNFPSANGVAARPPGRVQPPPTGAMSSGPPPPRRRAATCGP